MNRTVRLGLIGLGGMGQHHAGNIQSGKIPRLELAAVADNDPTRFAKFPGIPAFRTMEEMAASGKVDAVLIATPHFQHTELALTAIASGLHVMVEKPVAVHKQDAERLLGAKVKPGQVLAAMFNQRTDDYFIKIREMVRSGELGEVRRVNWTVTDWFRTHKYYGSGGWRATWGGEGGGVLLNQCPHNLDLLQWIFGSPKQVRAFCGFGRYHPIEVEDDVTAYLEFANGATGVFVTSTGESPGTNRLEITAERGRLVYEANRLVLQRNAVPMSEFSRTATEAFSRPPVEDVIVEAKGHGGQHVEVLQNFVAAILDGAAPVARAEEGLASLELANAMLLSAWTNETIELPLDGARYAKALQARINP